MAFKQLRSLTEPWWERQEGESHKAHARFEQYRTTPKATRSYRKVAESEGVNVSTIERLAITHRWQDRIAAWDTEQSRRTHERIADQSERLADAHIAAATEVLYAVRSSVRHVIDNGVILEPSDAAKWAEVSIKMAKAAKEAPDSVVAITGRDGGPVEVQIPELDGLPQQEQTQRLSEMLSSVARLDEHRTRRGGAA